VALGLLRLIIFIALVWFIVYTILRIVRQRPLPRRKSLDPYEVLEISRTASDDEIQEAYRNQLSKYHPDKVAHLGKDLQDLASEKTNEIIKAYKMLKNA
jgi:preprotein translocase subunit Sec63